MPLACVFNGSCMIIGTKWGRVCIAGGGDVRNHLIALDSNVATPATQRAFWQDDVPYDRIGCPIFANDLLHGVAEPSNIGVEVINRHGSGRKRRAFVRRGEVVAELNRHFVIQRHVWVSVTSSG